MFWNVGFAKNAPGNDLLSHTVARAVPSAQEGLASLFGMGRGVSPPPWSPEANHAIVVRDQSDVYLTLLVSNPIRSLEEIKPSAD